MHNKKLNKIVGQDIEFYLKKNYNIKFRCVLNYDVKENEWFGVLKKKLGVENKNHCTLVKSFVFHSTKRSTISTFVLFHS